MKQKIDLRLHVRALLADSIRRVNKKNHLPQGTDPFGYRLNPFLGLVSQLSNLGAKILNNMDKTFM